MTFLGGSGGRRDHTGRHCRGGAGCRHADDLRQARAIRDPVLWPALAAIHGSLAEKWGVGSLAQRAHVSISLLDERFRQVLGLAPIRYLTGWRMHIAEDLLRSSDLGVAAVARKVGYDSEEAFSRAFKREHSQAPSRWRVRRLRPQARSRVDAPVDMPAED
ncbi:MAG: helix-turn-helix transcriptional regulator [Geodermatophilaceae bacterium]|nr:helix-turn-helix transcriptional regulator [Geodermatophilaceae bacterium]